MKPSENISVAILATDGFEQSELLEPKKALEEKGITVKIVSLKSGKIKGWKDGNWANTVTVDVTVEDAEEKDYNALMLPGGVINPDRLRRDAKAVELVKSFFNAHKPVAAICHGPQILIEANVVDGRKLTSFSSIRTDLENAGANWMDKEVVVDHGLVTSRSPKDLNAFCAKLVEKVMESKHHGQTV